MKLEKKTNSKYFHLQVALTSEACLKNLPKTTAGEVVAFKGWPKLHWFVTEHLGKTPKDWIPPTRLTDDTPAYIEYTTDKDGSVMGVTVTRSAMLAHCRALTQVRNFINNIPNIFCKKSQFSSYSNFVITVL